MRNAAELTRVNSRNTMKINVERPLSLIQPRFGSFYFYFDGCKKGSINGYKPFVGVDGFHLKTNMVDNFLLLWIDACNIQVGCPTQIMIAILT